MVYLLLMRYILRNMMKTKVEKIESILLNSQRDNIWKFLDYNNEYSPNTKCRALSEYDLNLTTELYYLFFARLQNLIKICA